MKLRAIIFANVKLKLLSLFFAAVLWLFVTLETSDVAELPLAVKLVNIPAGLALQSVPAPPVSLRIAGPRTLLIRQRWQGAQVELDLAGAQAGRVMFSGLDGLVALIPGVRPVRVSPANLEILLKQED